MNFEIYEDNINDILMTPQIKVLKICQHVE